MTPTNPIACPQCDAQLIGHINASSNNRAPQNGDVGMCAHCSVIFVFTDHNGRLTTRPPTTQELGTYLAHPDIQRALTAVAIGHARGIIPPPGRHP